jgi:hypothetical protein
VAGHRFRSEDFKPVFSKGTMIPLLRGTPMGSYTDEEK